MKKQFEYKTLAYESDLKSRALNVLIYLVDRSNQEMTCFPSLKTIGKNLHISLSTVKRALSELVSAGFVKKDPRFNEKRNGAQTSNLYTLSMPLKKENNTKKEEFSIRDDDSSEGFKAFVPKRKQETKYITFEMLIAEDREKKRKREEELSDMEQGTPEYHTELSNPEPVPTVPDEEPNYYFEESDLNLEMPDYDQLMAEFFGDTEPSCGDIEEVNIESTSYVVENEVEMTEMLEETNDYTSYQEEEEVTYDGIEKDSEGNYICDLTRPLALAPFSALAPRPKKKMEKQLETSDGYSLDFLNNPTRTYHSGQTPKGYDELDREKKDKNQRKLTEKLCEGVHSMVSQIVSPVQNDLPPSPFCYSL